MDLQMGISAINIILKGELHYEVFLKKNGENVNGLSTR